MGQGSYKVGSVLVLGLEVVLGLYNNKGPFGFCNLDTTRTKLVIYRKLRE